jgi:FixJ family two-component response regulator
VSELAQLQALLKVPARLDELEELLERVTELLEGGVLPERPLTKTELAQALSVSERTVDNLRANGLPHFKVGMSPRFLLSEAIEWFRRRDVVDGLRLVEGGE